MISIFKQHPEIPNHYDLADGYYLLTSDRNHQQFKWSRIIRDNYIHGRGFLTHQGIDRVDFRIFYKPNEETQPVIIDQDIAIEQLQAILDEGKEAILHYYDKGNVMTVVTGIDQGMYHRLSEQYQQHYYEN